MTSPEHRVDASRVDELARESAQLSIYGNDSEVLLGTQQHSNSPCGAKLVGNFHT